MCKSVHTSNRLNDEGRPCSSNQTLHPSDVLVERKLIFIHVGRFSQLWAGVTHHRLAAFVGLSMEYSGRGFSPNWVSTKVKQAHPTDLMRNIPCPND